MHTEEIIIGAQKVVGIHIQLPGAPLLLIRGQKGYLMCGYLHLPTAQKLGQAAAVVRGVQTLRELLQKPVVEATEAAQRLGVTVGMSGQEALERLM